MPNSLCSLSGKPKKIAENCENVVTSSVTMFFVKELLQRRAFCHLSKFSNPVMDNF